MRVLLTGANGFIGREILRHLQAAGHQVRLAGRVAPMPPPGSEAMATGDLRALDAATAERLMGGMDAVIHAAGYAHALGDADPDQHRQVNFVAVARLAETAARAGARFIQISSVKAREPDSPYGRAKADAEAAIRAALPQEHVILRPTLVVGPGARGNLARLLRLARLPLPLPLKHVAAPRSMISRLDVAALAVRALQDAALSGQTLVLADPEPITLPDAIKALREGLGRPAHLFPVPQAWLEWAVRNLGRGEDADRLFSPAIHPPDALLSLGWHPQEPVRAALRRLASEAPRA